MSTRTTQQRFKLDYVKTIGVTTNQSGRGFINPYDIAISHDGRIFVLNHCDSARKNLMRIGICNLDEEYLGEFGKGAGKDDEQFNSPVAMAFDSQDRLYISDELNHRITIFDSSGKFLNKWDASGSGPGELNGPAGIAIDSQDNVYVVDQHNNRVQRFDSGGSFIAQWGEAGCGPGQFNLPWGVAVDSHGNVYVADWRNDRIQKFSPDGTFLMKFGTSGQEDGEFYRPTGIAVDKDGLIYVTDFKNDRLQVFDSDGTFMTKLLGEATLSKWGTERVNLDPSMVRGRLNAPGLEEREKRFHGPIAVEVDDDGHIFVVETSRQRLQVFRKQTAIFGGGPL